MKINGLFHTQEKQLIEQGSNLKTGKSLYYLDIWQRTDIQNIQRIQKSKKFKNLSKKWANEMNTQFSRDKTQMTKRNMFSLTSYQWNAN